MKNSTLIGFFLLMFCSVNAQVGPGYYESLSNSKSAKNKEDTEVTEEVKSNIPKSIVSTSAEIRTYYTDKTLKEMSKGALIDLYIEHLKVVIEKMPRIGLATKPGITIKDLGIPESADNIKLLDFENEATQAYLENCIDFLRKMLPYADKNQLVTMVLFYEQTLKSLHEVDHQ